MQELMILLLIAVLTETTVDWAKDFSGGGLKWQKFLALGAAGVYAFGTGTDFFALLQIPFAIPYVGVSLTAMVCSRGANWAADFWRYLNTITRSYKEGA